MFLRQKVSLLELCSIIALMIIVDAQYYSPPNMGGAVGCVVTVSSLNVILIFFLACAINDNKIY